MKLRFVFDTNVIVSALLFKDSLPRRAFDAALDSGKILISAPVLEELDRVLAREKFSKYVNILDRNRFLAALVREARMDCYFFDNKRLPRSQGQYVSGSGREWKRK
ncbi:MAG: PIN domain-containing protein [Burkholderiales bacterium]